MHIQITKTLDKAFGFAPKQQQVIIIILTRAGHQPNSKPPVKKNKNQPITNNLYQTVSLPLEVLLNLTNQRFSWYKLAGKSSDEFRPLNVKGVKVTFFFFIYLYIYKIKIKTQTEVMKKKNILVKTPGAYINNVCQLTL